MADPNQLAFLKRSVKEWNAWRKADPDVEVNLRKADLRDVNLRRVQLGRAPPVIDDGRKHVPQTDLREANLFGVILISAILTSAKLTFANLEFADLTQANRRGAELYQKIE